MNLFAIIDISILSENQSIFSMMKLRKYSQKVCLFKEIILSLFFIDTTISYKNKIYKMNNYVL